MLNDLHQVADRKLIAVVHDDRGAEVQNCQHRHVIHDAERYHHVILEVGRLNIANLANPGNDPFPNRRFCMLKFLRTHGTPLWL